MEVQSQNTDYSGYEALSNERKVLQTQGELPSFFTTGSWQVFKEHYKFQSVGFRGQIERITTALAQYAPDFLPPTHKQYNRIVEAYGDNWQEVFYNVLWKGHGVLSSPVLANSGTDRGSPVSCSGSSVEDSVSGFYAARHEAAVLTKEGFGTSAYLGNIRPRGAMTSKGFPASGSWPVFEGFSQDAKDVSQGATRRGAWAGYLEIDHDDFDEWCDKLHKNNKGKNIGWIITKDFIQRLDDDDEDALRRFKKALWVKIQTGKGYFWKVDHVNEQQPEAYQRRGLLNLASNLCTEITLFSDDEHSYSCILSSQNLIHYMTTKDTGLVFVMMVLLDCVTSEFLVRAESIPQLAKVARSTRKGRAVGLGTLGFHSLLQSKRLTFSSMEAHLLNTEIFKHMHDESLEASQWLAKELGEPEWCEGLGERFTHRTAIAPNFSSATIGGQVSQGIEPWFANTFIQPATAGELQRINPEFLKLAIERGEYSNKLISELNNKDGSVQDCDWLTPHEKDVFKTAFEIDMMDVLRLASQRQRYICQGQSLNLFFSAEEEEAYIAKVHKVAFLDKRIKGLYYLRTLAGVKASKEECGACEG